MDTDLLYKFRNELNALFEKYKTQVTQDRERLGRTTDYLKKFNKAYDLFTDECEKLISRLLDEPSSFVHYHDMVESVSLYQNAFYDLSN